MTLIRLSQIAAAATASTVAAGGDVLLYVLSFQFRSHRLRLVFVTKSDRAAVSPLYTL